MQIRTVSVLPLLLLATGCAPYRFHPAPVSSAATATSLSARTLDDAGLHAWMKEAANIEPASWPISSWNLKGLTLAAYYFSPAMDVARANAAAANATIKTATMKPNPAVGAGAGYETSVDSPYLLGFDFSLPIETAGKRGYRIAEAQHLSAASRIQIAETAWAVRSRVRASLVNLLFAQQAVFALSRQVAEETKYVNVLETRFHAGEIPLPDVTSAQISLTNLRQSLHAAEGQIGVAHAALAGAIGIPESGLEGKTFTWHDLDNPPVPNALPVAGVRAMAVENRLDVERALEDYQAAQSRLQLEVARQYPDINLGPGYAFEEGVHLISLQLSAVLPLRNHNEGPIAEAEAQRKVAGAQLLATQSTVIAQSDVALARYRSAFEALMEARRARTQAEAQSRTADQWLKSGEADSLATISAQIEVTTADRAQIDALQQVQLALGSLEDALQRPIAPATAPTLPRQAPR